jgi:hypothetical protein
MKASVDTSAPRWRIALSAIPLLVGIGLAIWIFVGGSVQLGPSFDGTSTRTRSVSASTTTDPSLPAGVAVRNIEDIRVGERVMAHNPELSDAERSEPDPDPSTWRKLDLAITKDDGYRLDITLLRPLEWLEQHRAIIGGTISLDIPEMNAYGEARVLNIGPCPQIKPGRGRVVIGTFRHTSGDTLNLGVSGLDEPIGTTADHPFWSEDRQAYIVAGKLRIGERVRTFSGVSAQISSISRRGPPEPVYNLEIHSEHVYYVSKIGVLVHNSYPESLPDRPKWRVGGSITQALTDGSYPKWFSNLASEKAETIQGRYWMNRAALAAPGEFSKRQLAKMQAGFAPQVKVLIKNRQTGLTEIRTISKELHHDAGRRGNPGFDEPIHLREVWPWEHELIDEFRHTGYDIVKILDDQ